MPSQQQQRILDGVLESLADGVAVADKQGRLILFNPAAEHIIGQGVTDARPEEWSKQYGLFLPDGKTPHPAETLPLARAIGGETVREHELIVRRPDENAVVVLSVNATPLIGPSGEIEGGVAVFRDISAHRRDLERLAESELRFRDVMEHTPLVVFIKDEAGRYVYGNAAWRRLLTKPDESLGRTDDELFPPDVARIFRQDDQTVRERNEPIQAVEETIDDDGERHWWSVSKFPMAGAGGQRLLGGIALDISDRKRMQERLESERQFLRRQLDLQERERKLVANEIHDGLIQDIVGAKMLLEGAAGHAGSRGPFDPALIEQAVSLMADAIAEGRRLISDLRPLVIDDEGIVASINFLISEKHAAGPVQVGFEHDVAFDRLDAMLEGAVYRIVQEALTNVQRHSRARRALVSLVQTGDRLRVEISDDGVGFDPAAIPSGRFGVRGIRQRAELFGGKAKIVSSAGNGARIVVTLPVGSE